MRQLLAPQYVLSPKAQTERNMAQHWSLVLVLNNRCLASNQAEVITPQHHLIVALYLWGCQKQTTNWWCKGPPVTPKTFMMFDVFYGSMGFQITMWTTSQYPGPPLHLLIGKPRSFWLTRCPFRSRCFPFTKQCCWELNQPTSYRFKLANLQSRDFRNGKCWKVRGIQPSSLSATPKKNYCNSELYMSYVLQLFMYRIVKICV